MFRDEGVVGWQVAIYCGRGSFEVGGKRCLGVLVAGVVRGGYSVEGVEVDDRDDDVDGAAEGEDGG